MTTFFGRRIDAMYHGCSRSSLVAVSTRDKDIRRTLYELWIKGWIPEFFVSSHSFESIKVRCQCYCKKQIDNNFPWPTIFLTITEQFLRALFGRQLWSMNKQIMEKTQFVFLFLALAIFWEIAPRVVSPQSTEHFDVISMIDKKNCCRFVK